MKLHALILACTASLLASPARADARISFDFFHDSLSPYGDWNETDRYGLVWHPSGVDRDWSPYSDGYWSYTDAGWTWVSYEDFGGICYHYGRWVQLEEAGWCWVPGYDWAPAWVSWRRNNDYVGWAPLPPEARWEVKVGFSSWVDTHYDIGPGWYSFCHSRDFGAPVIRHVILPRSRNVTIINVTNNITNITYNRDSGYIFNGGLDYDAIAPRCSHALPTLKLVQQTNNIFVTGNRGNVFINTQKGNALYIAAPQRADSNWSVPTKKPIIANVFKVPSASHGWAGMDKDGTREKLLVKMRGEVQGATPESQPARAFRPESVAVIPKKADPTLPRPSLLKSTVNRDANGERPEPTTLKQPIARPMPPEPSKLAKENDRPSTLKQPILRPPTPPSREDTPTPKIPRAEVQPQRPPTIARPPEDSGLRKQIAEQQQREQANSAARAREATIAREKASRDAEAQRAEDNARRKQAAAQDQQRQAADTEKTLRKQTELRRASEENQQRQQAIEQQRRAQDRAASENAQRQANAARQQAEATMRKQAPITRPPAPAPTPSRALTPEQQEELLKKKKTR